jgi:hypothetical protein
MIERYLPVFGSHLKLGGINLDPLMISGVSIASCISHPEIETFVDKPEPK